MTLNRTSRSFRITFALLFILTTAISGCGSSNSSTSGDNATIIATPNGYTLPPLSGPNVLTLTVNGSTCSANSYVNKPCVSIQLCAPNNSSNCQTISDILVDTGSFGLRVFSSAISSNILSTLTPITSGGNPVAECVQYGDGSKDWGPVKTAGIILGGEAAVQVPIQVIDSTFSNSAAYCSGAETSPSNAGFNGILGVGLFVSDCGSGCANHSSNGLYFSCSGSTCSGAAVSLANQVQNPVASLATDNNGIILELPLVPLAGQASANGYLVLGIGTQSNNVPGAVTAFSASASTGDFSTSYNGQTYTSFLDSGSNGFFFPGSLPNCGSISSNLAGWFCPSSTETLSATNIASSGSQSGLIQFQVGDLASFNSNNHVFMDIGGGSAGGFFDWGLPFYIGRNIYVGFQGFSSTLGSGPYWAF